MPWRLVLVLVLLLLARPVQAQVYKCPDGKGGTVFRNAPCSGSDDTPLLTHQPAPPPPAAPFPSLPPVVPPSLPSQGPCLEIVSMDHKILGKRARFTEVSWRVSIFNKCERQLQPLVTFSLHDKNGFELKHHAARGVAPAREVRQVHGVLSLRNDLVQRVHEHRAVARP